MAASFLCRSKLLELTDANCESAGRVLTVVVLITEVIGVEIVLRMTGFDVCSSTGLAVLLSMISLIKLSFRCPSLL